MHKQPRLLSDTAAYGDSQSSNPGLFLSVFVQSYNSKSNLFAVLCDGDNIDDGNVSNSDGGNDNDGVVMQHTM